MKRFAFLLAAVPFLAGAAPGSNLTIELTGVRGGQGFVHACLTRAPAFFPDCQRDPNAVTETVPAADRQIEFRGVPPGRYAITLFHDANANRKLDKFMGVPREGFAFSRNPVIRFSAPQFDKVSILLAPGFTRVSVRMQYLL